MVTLSTGSGVVVGWRRKTDMTWRLRVNRFPIHSKARAAFSEWQCRSELN